MNGVRMPKLLTTVALFMTASSALAQIGEGEQIEPGVYQGIECGVESCSITLVRDALEDPMSFTFDYGACAMKGVLDRKATQSAIDELKPAGSIGGSFNEGQYGAADGSFELFLLKKDDVDAQAAPDNAPRLVVRMKSRFCTESPYATFQKTAVGN